MFVVLTKREQYIAYGTGAALALLALSYFVLAPYFAARHDRGVRLAAVEKQDRAAENLFKQQQRMQRVWLELKNGGLKTDPAEAESQMLHALGDWAAESGVNVAGLRPEQQKPDGRFLQISFHITGTGPTAAAAKLLWRIETAVIPVRVNEVQLTPRKEGVDDLQIQISVSTLCLLPEGEKGDKNLGGRSVTSIFDARGDRP